MEQSNDGSLEFRSTSSVDGGGRESLPDDALANVGGNEKRDTGSKTVTLLEELIEKNDNETCNNELENKEKANTSTKITGLSVETSQNVDGSLSERKNNGKHYRLYC